ncbi:unnamed protein product [marine sediment metagenome]|uniref:Uncharacterized protein n=1 Tax=marine sediment metagenome TaxID=412755 RepID=X0W2U3_9ZZZZ
MPMRVDNMMHNNPKFKAAGISNKISIISCGVCEIVQNMERWPKIKKFRYSELKKKGWTIYNDAHKKNEIRPQAKARRKP